MITQLTIKLDYKDLGDSTFMDITSKSVIFLGVKCCNEVTVETNTYVRSHDYNRVSL